MKYSAQFGLAQSKAPKVVTQISPLKNYPSIIFLVLTGGVISNEQLTFKRVRNYIEKLKCVIVLTPSGWQK